MLNRVPQPSNKTTPPPSSLGVSGRALLSMAMNSGTSDNEFIDEQERKVQDEATLASQGAWVLERCLSSSPMDPTQERADFFPSKYKFFKFKEGDILALPRQHQDSGGGGGEGPTFTLLRVLKIDMIELPRLHSINIAGDTYTVPKDDWITVVSYSVGQGVFKTMDEAKRGATNYNVRIDHIPARTTFADGAIRVFNAPVREDELFEYRSWKAEFDEGHGGIM